MLSIMKRLAGAAVALTLVTSMSWAGGVRIRGEVVDINETTYTILGASGQEVAVAINEPVVLVYTDIDLSDVADNSYVSVPSVAMGGDTWRALGVTVFPEPMRGMNEGFADWDLTSESKMTNATVGKVVSRGGERVLTLSYGANEQVVVVADNAPITTFGPDPDRAIQRGDLVVVFAEGKKGAFSGKFVAIHADGSLPPV